MTGKEMEFIRKAVYNFQLHLYTKTLFFSRKLHNQIAKKKFFMKKN